MQPPKLEWATVWLHEKRNGLSGSSTTPIINPTTEEKLIDVVETDAHGVDQAVERSRQAFHVWSKTSRRSRMRTLRNIADAIRRHHSELATLETLQNGKTFLESFHDDLPESADVFDYYAGWTDKLYGESSPVEGSFINFVDRVPVGVCALIVPWNFPLLLACWKIAPALAMGNTVIVKPSPYTPLTVIRLAEILRTEQILPEGVLEVVTGGEVAGKALSSHRGIDKISFTGSTPIGKHIASASALSNLKSVSLELGGKSANIIFEDVSNLEPVIQRSFQAMFSHKGEKCSEPTRLFLHESIHDSFVEALVAKAEKVTCGDPFTSTTQQGPQCHLGHFQKIQKDIANANEDGAKLVTGGEVDSRAGNGKGYFIRPTIFTGVTPDMRLFHEEVFGPVLSVTKFKSESEAIGLANQSRFGLAAGLYTDNAQRAIRVAKLLEAGQVFVNHYGCYDFAAPFGGWKESGWGQEMARHSLDSYTKIHSIWLKY